ncbi:hypothetical protein ACP4OV_018160 [Aristida adscensionis]
MIPGAGGGSSYFLPNYQQQQQQQQFHGHGHGHGLLDGMDGGGGGFMGGGGAQPAVSESDAHCHALLYNLSVLKEKVQQLQPLVGFAVAHGGHGGPAAAVSGASAVIQEIISAASSMMYAFQQLCGHGAPLPPPPASTAGEGPPAGHSIGAVAVSHHGAAGHAKNGAAAEQAAAAVMEWQHQHQHQHGGYDNRIPGEAAAAAAPSSSRAPGMDEEAAAAAAAAAAGGAIIELDAAELLAKYTLLNTREVCGKGFKPNLRMHMRAHGDEYKSSAALANPAKASAGAGEGNSATAAGGGARAYYSCPAEGCRWNRRHAKFQPLKSVICAKKPLQAQPLPQDVRVQALPRQALLGAVRPAHPREALRRPPVGLLLRHLLLPQGQAPRPPRALRRPPPRRPARRQAHQRRRQAETLVVHIGAAGCLVELYV